MFRWFWPVFFYFCIFAIKMRISKVLTTQHASEIKKLALNHCIRQTKNKRMLCFYFTAGSEKDIEKTWENINKDKNSHPKSQAHRKYPEDIIKIFWIIGNHQVLPKSSTNPGTSLAFSYLRGHSSSAQSQYVHKTSFGNASQVPEAVKLSCQQGFPTWV